MSAVRIYLLDRRADNGGIARALWTDKHEFFPINTRPKGSFARLARRCLRRT